MKHKIYLISANFEGNKLYKIGYTKREVSERIKSFETGNVSDFEIIDIFECVKYHSTLENRLHKYFAKKKVRGEWFSLDKDDVDSFQITCNRLWNQIEFLSTENTYIVDRGIKFK